MARTILVGDIHACGDELSALLEKVNYAQGVDQLVLVGDLVARGPDSGVAVQRAIEFGARSVRGNHDEKLLRWWREAKRVGRKRANERVKLGERHMRAVGELTRKHFEHLAALPLVIDLPEHDVVVVHAGFAPGVERAAQDPAMMMNIRSIDASGAPTKKLDVTPWATMWAGPGHVVFGHDARRGLQLEPHATGLDTGCCYGRQLTALVLDAGEPVPAPIDARRAKLVAVTAREAYCPMGDGNGPE